MTGHVRRRGTHSWEIKFDLGADALTGKRRSRYVAFKGTKRAAEVELARLVSQNAAGEGVDPSKSTVAEFIERWDKDWATANVGPKTLERYRDLFRLYVKPNIGAVRIQKLRAVHLNELYSTLLRSGGHDGAALSPRSVGHVHRVLHRALGHAATWGVVANNVASLVGPPPVPDDEIKILTEGQIGTLLRHLEGRNHGRTLRSIVSFLLGTGARRGEALALRWSDVDLQISVVRIERSLEQTKGSLRVKSPKTKNGRRNIAISPWLAAELRAHRARQDERRLKLGKGRPNDTLVFASWDGEFRSPSRVSQDFAAARDALKIDCTLHGLRHTHVSQLIAAGLDVLTISRRIGHASPAITLKIYGHMFSNTDARAAEIMEATFAKVRSTV
jgi:integrase